MRRLCMMFFILCVCVGCQEAPFSTSSETEGTKLSGPVRTAGDETDPLSGRSDEPILTTGGNINEDAVEAESPLSQESASSSVEKELSQIASLFMKAGSSTGGDVPRGSWSFSVYNPKSGYTYYYDGYNNLLGKKSR